MNKEKTIEDTAGSNSCAPICSALINAAIAPSADGYYLVVYGNKWRKAYFSIERNEWSEGHMRGLGCQNHGLKRPDFWGAVYLQNAHVETQPSED